MVDEFSEMGFAQEIISQATTICKSKKGKMCFYKKLAFAHVVQI